MIKRIALILVLFFSFNSMAHTNAERSEEWVFSGGMGLTFSPSLFLLSPQIEYQLHPRTLVGALIQAGVGDSTLVTVGGSLRYLIGNDPKFRPSIEGDLGITSASVGYAARSGNTNTFGIHLGAAIGFDYFIQHTVSLGTMFRVNFSPPIKTVFLSWPVLTARFIL
jgi:hypothetical protein